MIKVNAMAPLIVSDAEDFARTLDVIARMNPGSGISVDVWRGLVEVAPHSYDFRYYDWLFDAITARGLKVVLIVSLHACGGNVGDDIDIPLPEHLWNDLSRKTGLPREQLMCIAETGHVSRGFVSPWMTPFALEGYDAFFCAILKHFGSRANQIAEIIISTGEAGELRYPSYGVPGYGFPTRGALQCYSQPALQSFRSYALNRFGGLRGVRAAWQWNGREEEILPPSNPEQFFARQDDRFTIYGQSFFDWYSDSLLWSGRQILMTALARFAARSSAFRGVELGVKVAGIHWQIGRRLGRSLDFYNRHAELTAGLVRTSDRSLYDISDGFGYSALLEMFARVASSIHPLPFTVHFTCAEMADARVWHSASNQHVDCLPHTLISCFTAKARKLNLTVKAENALECTLSQPDSWATMEGHLLQRRVAGMTLLRAPFIVQDPVARRGYSAMVAKVRALNSFGGQAA